MRRVSLIAVFAAFFGVCAWAQDMPRMAGARLGGPAAQRFRFAPPRNGSFVGLSGVPFDREHHRRGFGQNSFLYGGWPYFPPEYEAPEPVIYVQPPVTPATAAPAPPPRQEPIPSGALLELQGNQWVKVTAFTTIQPQAAAASASAPIAAKELPPAILVYRDGHSEELRSYSIIGRTIFAKADYATAGAWIRKIQIADLDLRATIKQNRDRGLNFDLPSGPDEVILRP